MNSFAKRISTRFMNHIIIVGILLLPLIFKCGLEAQTTVPQQIGTTPAQMSTGEIANDSDIIIPAELNYGRPITVGAAKEQKRREALEKPTNDDGVVIPAELNYGRPITLRAVEAQRTKEARGN